MENDQLNKIFGDVGYYLTLVHKLLHVAWAHYWSFDEWQRLLLRLLNSGSLKQHDDVCTGAAVHELWKVLSCILLIRQLTSKVL